MSRCDGGAEDGGAEDGGAEDGGAEVHSVESGTGPNFNTRDCSQGTTMYGCPGHRVGTQVGHQRAGGGDLSEK